jgi:amidase
LKTTFGRVPLEGVWPLAPSFDTVGPMASTVAGLVAGMQLLEPGFAPSAATARVIGRLPTQGDPSIEQAVDTALREAEFDTVSLDWDDFEAGTNAWTCIYFSELWEVDHDLVAAHPDDIGDDIAGVLAMADLFRPGVEEARRQLAVWRRSLLALFERVELIALPTLPIFPPRLDGLTADSIVPTAIELTKHVSLFNAAGTPCTAQPIPVPGSALPASLELVGPLGAEELLLATAQAVESAMS